MGKSSRIRRERAQAKIQELSLNDVFFLLYSCLVGLHEHVHENTLNDERLSLCALASDVCGMVFGTGVVGVFRDGVGEEDYASLISFAFTVISEVENLKEEPLRETLDSLPAFYAAVDTYIGGEGARKIKEVVAASTGNSLSLAKNLVKTLRTLYEKIVWNNCRTLDGETLEEVLRKRIQKANGA